MYVPSIRFGAESVTDSRCVLALDMARATGAAARARDGKVKLYLKKFPKIEGAGGGWLWLNFRHWLTETKNKLDGIDAVYWEKLDFVGTSTQNARLKFGFEAILTGWCEHHEIPYKGFSPGTIKNFITGNGHADKDAVMAAVNALGFQIEDDNVSDATAILMLALDRMDLDVILPTREPEPKIDF